MSQSGDKSEKPTDKRRQDARKKGNVAKSMDLGVGLRFMVAIFLLRAILLPAWEHLRSLTVSAWTRFPTEVGIDQAHEMLRYYSGQVLLLLAPLLGCMLLLGLATNVVQVGVNFNPSLLKFDLNRVNPFGPSGFKRFFGAQPYQQLAVNLAKLVVLGWLGWVIVSNGYARLLSTVQMDLGAAGRAYADLVWEVCWKIGLALLILGIVDWILAKRRHEKGLKMSKQEVKDENKSQDGDPQVKGRQRQIRMAQSRKRMMGSVPNADVVVTNPTHFAVAIQYDSKAMGAPTVVAKGVDNLALKIRELAQEHGVPIVENPPLARALYAQVEVEHEIPSELYAAVSDVLIYVYRLSGKLKF